MVTDDPEVPAAASLLWGIKASFIDYIFKMPDGQASVTDGARPVSSHEFIFEPGERPTSKADGQVWRFRGDVRFAGHAGILFVRVADPWLHIGEDQTTLSIVNPFDPASDERLELVTLRLRQDDEGGDNHGWRSGTTRLTAEGAEMFNGAYLAGEPFAPLRVTTHQSSPPDSDVTTAR